MRLHEKLLALQAALGIKNAALARQSGLDAASVSRFLQGKRLFPYKYLPLLCDTMARLFPQGVDGVALPLPLRVLCGEGWVDSALLAEKTLLWLQDSPEYEKKHSNAGRKRKAGRAPDTLPKIFGEKLSLLMDIAGISGAQLAGALYLDPSMIYKYRIGTRIPKQDTLDNVVRYICSRVKGENERRRILDAASAGPVLSGLSAEDFRLWMLEWLSEEHTWAASTIESLLETIDDFAYFGGSSGIIPLEEIAPLAGDVLQNESFWGIEGMRYAATRYLYYAATLDAPVTLRICTTSSLDFVTMDLRWKAVWGSLMIHCLLKGHTIKIIYNMADRSVAEIMEAIEAFVPLYMVGRMEPYTFKKPQGNTLRHTTYLIEDHVAVTASYAEGLDDEAEYVYSTQPQRLAAQKKHFDALLANSASLMDIYRSADGMEGFDIRLGRFWGLSGDATLLLPSLSLATLPESVLEAMLCREAPDAETRAKIEAVYTAEKRWLNLQLSAGKISELSVIADEEELAAGDVCFDIPSHLIPKPVAYTREEYAAHLAHIRRLQKEQPNYRFHELARAPFRNIKVYHKPAEVIVQKAGYPSAAFAIDNVYMCRGFEHFLPRLGEG